MTIGATFILFVKYISILILSFLIGKTGHDLKIVLKKMNSLRFDIKYENFKLVNCYGFAIVVMCGLFGLLLGSILKTKIGESYTYFEIFKRINENLILASVLIVILKQYFYKAMKPHTHNSTNYSKLVYSRFTGTVCFMFFTITYIVLTSFELLLYGLSK